MSLSATPAAVAVDATSFVIYQGTPHRTVAWTLTGDGTLNPLSGATDQNGSAAAIYIPGTVGDTVTITVTAGA